MAFGGGFGASPSPGFGFGTPSSTPAFGASSASPFGANTGSTMFGATSTPAFGAATSAPAFGASGTPSLFAASSPFGTPGSSPAFGATPGSAPSFFGASSSAASSGGAFSFGSTPAFGNTGGAFGSSIFGSSSSSAAQTSSSFFGQQQQPQQQSNPFALALPQQQQQQQQQQQALPQQQQQQLQAQHLLTLQQQEFQSMRRELEAIVAAYNPSSAGFKFQTLFLNVVDNLQQRVKPPGLLDEVKWKQALRDAGGPNNVDNLWPVLSCGFSDLVQRGEVQAQAIAENRQRMDQIKELVHKLRLRLEHELAARVSAARQRHLELSSRLLALSRCVYALEGRLALFSGRGLDVSRAKESGLSSTLEGVEAQLSLTSPSGLMPRMEALKAAARLASSAPLPGPEGGGGLMPGDHPSVAAAFTVLQDHLVATSKLQEQLKRDAEDVANLLGQEQNGTSVSSVVVEMA